MKLPISELRAVAMSAPREAFVFENGKKGEKRVVDASGRSISRVKAVGAVVGDELIELSLEIPDKIADEVQAGDVVVVTGENMFCDVKGGDFYSVTGAIRDIEACVCVGKFTAILAQVA